MNFIGSKDRLLGPLLDRAIAELGIAPGRLGDAFAGTHAVGRHYQALGWEVFANDWQAFSACLGHAMLMSEHPRFEGVAGQFFPEQLPDADRLDAVVGHLNMICDAPTTFWRADLYGSWFIDDYCQRGEAGGYPVGGERMYFATANGTAIQAIREGIDQMPITPDEKGLLVASLIHAADKVANTASVYAAYLKAIKATAAKALRLKSFTVTTGPKATITNLDVHGFLASAPELDVLYLDPPYNHRQYCPNYHILETIARWDRPVPRGKTGVRPYADLKSLWCSRRTVQGELERVAEAARARWVLLSYSSDGLMTKDQIIATLAAHGRVTAFEMPLKRFRADKDSATRTYKSDVVTEYLFALEKT